MRPGSRGRGAVQGRRDVRTDQVVDPGLLVDLEVAAGDAGEVDVAQADAASELGAGRQGDPSDDHGHLRRDAAVAVDPEHLVEADPHENGGNLSAALKTFPQQTCG